MTRIILWRLSLALLTLFVVSVVIFSAVQLLPGDVAEQLLGAEATPATLAALRKELGLDVPAYLRYLTWAERMLVGDFGNSIATQRSISELLGSRFENTLILALGGAVVAIPTGVIFGILAALYRGRLFDKAINITTLATISFPEYFIAYILITLLSVKLGLVPSLSDLRTDMSPLERLNRLVLPVLTLAASCVGYIMRLTRAAIINVLSDAYIQMAELKGLSKWYVVVVHALPNALAPIINVVAIILAYLIVGVVIVETVFVYPGMGQLLVNSVSKRDVTVVQAVCLIFGSFYIGINLIADILSIISNPRLRQRR